MKVKDLIKVLKKYRPDAEICVQNDNYHEMDLEVREYNQDPVFVVFPSDLGCED